MTRQCDNNPDMSKILEEPPGQCEELDTADKHTRENAVTSAGKGANQLDKEGDQDGTDQKRNQSEEHEHQEAIKLLNPSVKEDISPPKEIPVDRVNIVSILLYHWLTKFLWRTYRKGSVDLTQIWKIPKKDSAGPNGQRLSRLWQEEIRRKGPEAASLGWTIFRFIRSRLFLSGFVFLFSLCSSFVGPIYLIRSILDYSQDKDVRLGYGLALVVGLFLSEMCRILTFCHCWFINYRTGVQAKVAVLTLVFDKILKLRSLKDKSAGELVNLCAVDGQRIFEAISIGPYIIGGPLMGIVGTIYCTYLVGPSALLGSLIFVLFYPYQFVLSRALARLRRKAVTIADKRVRMMNEILVCIKLIKMYAWEKPFAKTIAGIRRQERVFLEKSAFLQTLSIAFTPMMPVFAAVCTFVVHVMAGNDLTATQAFSVLVFYVMTRPLNAHVTLFVIRYSDLSVTAMRIKAFNILAFYIFGRPLLVNVSEFFESYSNLYVTAMRMKAFTVYAMFHNMGACIIPVGHFAGTIANLVVAARRFKSILLMEEQQPINTNVADPTSAVEIIDGTFAWDYVRSEKVVQSAQTSTKTAAQKDTESQLNGDAKVQRKARDSGVEHSVSTSEARELLHKEGDVRDEAKDSLVHTLVDINLIIPKGQLYGICGSVGSGKSSLLSAILGYDRVLEDCCLHPDLEALPAADDTEIGERGINLSGGQKQRVSLARAVYADRDIYLLDDPLSAVDAHVGQHLFEKCLKGALQSKTVIFVTHQLQYLSQCDQVLLMRDGCIAEQGSHEELMEREEEYAHLIKSFHTQQKSLQDDTDGDDKRDIEMTDEEARLATNYVVLGGSVASMASVASDVQSGDENAKKSDGRLIEAEEMEKGSVGGVSYRAYMKAAGGYIVSVAVLLFFGVPVGVSAFSNWWLSYWLRQGSGLPQNSTSPLNKTITSDNIRDNPKLYFYVGIYGGTAIAVILTMIVRGLLFIKATLRASSNLHDGMFAKVIRSPMSFFDITPVGRVLNRFSKDMDEMDAKLPLRVESLMQNIYLVLASFIIICIVFPWCIIALVPLALVFLLMNHMYRVAFRQLKRVDNVSRSPIFSHITTTVQGLHTIHAYGKQEEFLDRFKELLDVNSSPFLLHYMAMRWMALRLDLMCTLITTTTALLVILLKNSVPTALAGLALAYSMQMTGLFQYTIRLISEVEANFTAVERIQAYILYLKEEAPAIIKNKRPPKEWPSEGTIRFEDYKMRYRPGLPLVLKGLNLDISAQEKVGIVGRTGSGKSSLGVALFRLVEAAGGRIEVDGIRIEEIGLEDLRSQVSIIPQDPVLFVGTIRYNLDPFGEHSDVDLWEALEKCHIKDTISALERQLDSPVVESGENFSVGERQLICMARALLRNSKILMLDEATAAIDTQTDTHIQQTIKEAFANCTMLTIAHRINTVRDYDRIMVLKKGKIVEFDTPTKLLENPNTLFAKMSKAAQTQEDKKHC